MTDAVVAPPTTPSASVDEATALASLDALVLSERRVVTHRALSSHLSIPTPSAKAALSSYAKSHSSDVAVAWVVTLPGHRVALAGGDYPGPAQVRGENVLSCSVWAVAASGLVAGEEGVGWVASDRVREFEMVKAPKDDVNELRVDKWAVVKSASSGWNAGGRERSGGDKAGAPRRSLGRGGSIAQKAAAGISKKENVSVGSAGQAAKPVKSKAKGGSRVNSLVERIKAEDAAREKDRLAKKKAVASKSTMSKSTMDKFTTGKKASDSAGGKRKSISGGSAAAKKDSRGSKGKPPVSRKTRKLVDSEDESDGANGSNHGNNEGDDEDDVEMEALAREEEEAEEAERVRGEMDLESNDVQFRGQVDAPAAEDGNVSNEAQEANSDDSRGHSKRLAGGASGRPPSKRTKKMVDVCEPDEKGYIVTKRVAKYVDEEGNEHSDADGAEPATDTQRPSCFEKRKASPEKTGGSRLPSGESNVRSKLKSKSRNGSANASTKPKPSTKGAAPASKKGKKGKKNGNIASFFS